MVNIIFNRIKKEILIDYLIREIDCLSPVELIYKQYCDELIKISKINYDDNIISTFREKFIILLNMMEKKDILDFCDQEYFTIDIEFVEDVLGRILDKEDLDV